MSSRSQLRYVPALDGVRALSITAVFLDHASYGYYVGGMLGVDVFFVLSGFLITTILIDDIGRNDRIDFARFFSRRCRRLLPALAVTLIMTALVWPWSRVEVPLGPPALASALYYANWLAAFDPAAMGLFGQTWSLSIEEQFYFGWPLVLVFLASTCGRWRTPGSLLPMATAVTVALIVAAVFARGWLFSVGSPLGQYYSTISRIDAILIGCLGALLFRQGHLRRVFGRPAGEALAWIGGAVIVAMSLVVTQSTPFLYFGGLTLVACAAAAIVLQVNASPSGAMTRLLSHDILVQIGRRSYGIYLYHALVLHFTEYLRIRDSFVNFGLVLSLSIGVTLGISWISFKYIETPFLQHRRRAAPAAQVRQPAEARP